jgi:hypothetical protein
MSALSLMDRNFLAPIDDLFRTTRKGIFGLLDPWEGAADDLTAETKDGTWRATVAVGRTVRPEDIRVAVEDEGRTLAVTVSRSGKGTHGTWGSTRQLYLDLPANLAGEPEAVLLNGTLTVEAKIDPAQAKSVRIPVTKG